MKARTMANEDEYPVVEAIAANPDDEAEAQLADTGRVLVRASGTEPLIRVMVEAASAEHALLHAQALAQVVEGALS